jgi:uncharacterized protein YkwD
MKEHSARVLLGLLLLGIVGFALYYFTNMVDAPKKPAMTSQTEVATPESILAEVNKQRARAGAPLVKLDDRLNKSAQAKANDEHVNNYYAHDSPKTGKHGYDWIDETGIKCKPGTPAENLASGGRMDAFNLVSAEPTNDDPYGSWMSSKEHREAMLNPGIDVIGFGVNDGLAVLHMCDLVE